jgi:aryl-alcohol dehydrogenase-like predicted oxidoreductase
MRATLPTRRLGTSDLHLTTVGFGAWAVGGGGWAFGWGPQDDAESIASIRHALERGVNWIDTAAVYGLGHSEHGTGVIGYSPMQSGLLTERFSVERAESLPEGDWRRRSQDFKPPKLAKNLALRDALLPIAREHGTTVSAVAIAWTLAWPGVTGAIVGARTPDQVDGWIGAASLELTLADLDQIARAVGETGAGSGPALPR